MVHAPTPAAVEALRNSTSVQQQHESLKQLKNSIIGHDQIKESAVRHGVVESLVAIRSGEARLQSTIISGSIANGGAAFVAPLVAAGLPQHLLEALSWRKEYKLVTASLRALKSLALSWKSALESGESTPLDIFNDASLADFLLILQQPVVPEQLTLTCDLIALLAQDDATRSRLTQSSILDTLASLLVSYAVAKKQLDYRSETRHLLPAPAERAIPNILAAIASIITGSSYRAHRFILSEAVKDLFLNFAPGEGDLRYMMGPRHGLPNAEGSLLPPLHVPSYKSVSFSSSAFPAQSQRQATNGPTLTGDMDHANAVIGWLLHFARSLRAEHRVTALRLLALVNEAVDMTNATPKADYMQRAKERERQLCLLAVPLAVKLVQSGEDQACEVLAILVGTNRELQAAAVDAGAIKYVCPILKKSFDNVPLTKPMWSPDKTVDGQMGVPPSRQMGSRGLPAEIMHAMRCRKGALDALAAIASQKEDVHRKAIVDAGAVSSIIDSLKAFKANLRESITVNKGQLSAKDGNTTAVVLAACHAAKSLSRSVSLLRTSLIDAGIAKPIFELLSYQNLDVQIAATNVCANLLLDFSPMRDDLVKEGVVRTLCDHARLSSSALRLSSLWCLKHLVHSAPRELRISVLDELGTGWLVSAISGEQRENGAAPGSNGGVSVGLSSSNAAGEQVSLLNPSYMDLDEPVDMDDEDDDLDDNEDDDGEIMYDEPSNTHYQASSLRSTLPEPTSAFNSSRYLSSVRELEQNPILQAKRDDIAIQEQALDFIRNMLNGEECAVMIDHLFQELGHQKIFDLLTAKLTPLPASQRPANSQTVYNPTELVLSAVHVIAHIANGSPSHKQQLIAQRPLLQAWVQHFVHSDRHVRVMCVWGVNSLTWIEDERDRGDARLRVQELRAFGIVEAVRGLANDSDLDVRERVKTALKQIDGL